MLKVGALGAGGLCLSDLLRLRASAQAAGVSNPGKDDTAVLLVWLPGGPPHMETYDMKPDAPAEYRGHFQPIKTNVRGIEVCEHLPLHAKMADKYTLIRSFHHDFADHGGGHKRFLTGRDPAQPTGFVNDAPAVPCIVSKCQANRNIGLPNVVALTDRGRDGVDVFSLGAAYLGPMFTPFMVGGDPSSDKFSVRNLDLNEGMAGRMEDRLALLRGMDQMRHLGQQAQTMDAMDEFNQRAFDLLTSKRARDAFDLSQEPENIRSRYGHHAYGQRALMGRRLIEAGCTFVTVVLENPAPTTGLPKYACYNWDSHAVNCHLFEDALFRLPYYDQAITALIEDLYQRGLDKKVMLVVTGEFGRTPRISYSTGTQTGVTQPGRDHWPSSMSVLVSGGGMRTGQVIGSTDALGEHPKDRPMTPNDLWASVYQHLGINYDRTFDDLTGRPMPLLPYGQPIPELF